MKAIHKIIIIAFATLILSGCNNALESEIEALRNRVKALEELCITMNSDISSLKTIVEALENNDQISNILPISENGEITGYNIVFSSGTTITLNNGTDGKKPVIGIQQYNSNYYWTIKMGDADPEWMINSFGIKIRATGTAPTLKIESGYWWYSYDAGVTWYKLSIATGEEGSSVFKNVDYSDPYFVIFTLNDNTVIRIPTMTGFEELVALCDTINSNISAYKTLISGLDTNYYIKSVSEIVSNGSISGYKLLLNNGEELSIYHGNDGAPVYMGIEKDPTDEQYYWTMRYSETGSDEWVVDSLGNRFPANPTNGTPSISVRDTLGSYHFVISYDTGGFNWDWIRDDNGNLIQASGYKGFRYFDSVNIGTQSVSIKLGDGSTLELPLYRAAIPKITFTTPTGMTFASGIYDGVEANSTYVINWSVTDTTYGTPPTEVSPVSVTAIGLDSCVVTAINTTNTTVINGTNRNFFTITGTIAFKTPLTFIPNTETCKIAVFLLWEHKTTMKVLEFNNILP